MPEPCPGSYSLEIIDFLHTLVSLKKRLKLGLPENLVMLKTRLDGLNLAEKPAVLNNHDLFYSVGITFSSHPERCSNQRSHGRVRDDRGH